MSADTYDERLAVLEARLAQLDAAAEPRAAPLGFFQVAPGESILSDHMNTAVLQGINPFATAAARSAAIPTPTAGMLTWLASSGLYETYQGGAWTPVAPQWGLTGGLDFTQAGLNNRDCTGTVTVPAKPYARILQIDLRGTFTVVGAPGGRLRIKVNGGILTPTPKVTPNQDSQGLTTLHALAANAAATVTGNLEVASGATITSYAGENLLTVVAHPSAGALALLETRPAQADGT